MTTMMVGANPAELDDLATRMEQAGTELLAIARQVLQSVHASSWNGASADRFRDQWEHDGRTRLLSAAGLLSAAAATARSNAQAQRSASAAASGSFGAGVGNGPGGPGGSGGPAGPGGPGRSGPTPPRPLTRDEAVAAGRDGIADALHAVYDTERDEIQIRELENGTYIVVLPGVVDLTAGLEVAVDAAVNPSPLAILGGPATIVGSAVFSGGWEWVSPNDANSVRDMRNAIPSGLSPDLENPYSTRVKEAMQEAGVPPGAEVMLVGHSYGAYAAAHLASDRGFNDELGASSGYHVRVTHVVAAAAETDVYLDRLPPGTHSLILNNRNDLAYRAEDLSHDNVDASHSNHLEVVFNGSFEGAGHEPSNYIDHIRSNTDQRFEDFLATASGYDGPSTSSNHRVPEDR